MVEGVEEGEKVEEIYMRRMGMRNYFKELKMNIERIKKQKGEIGGKNNKKAFKEEGDGKNSEMKKGKGKKKTVKKITK
jgi:hypothetical protein